MDFQSAIEATEDNVYHIAQGTDISLEAFQSLFRVEYVETVIGYELEEPLNLTTVLDGIAQDLWVDMFVDC